MQSTDQPTVAVILAAGKGTRMRSSRAKALFPLCGRPLAEYPVRAVRRAGIDRVVLVVGHQAEAVRAAMGEGVEFAEQTEQLGTGHAVQSTQTVLEGFTGTMFVHCVDAPLLPAELITALLRKHREEGNAATILTAEMADAGKYGRIVRDETGQVRRIVEARDCTPEQLAIREVNAGTYCYEAPLIFEALKHITPENDQKEYLLTDVIAWLLAQGKRVGAMTSPDEGLVAGINDRAQLAEAETRLRDDIRKKHMLGGVSMIDPASTFIDEDVEIGQDTTIYPFSMIFSGTRIGSNCVIGPYSQLYDATIEDNAEVWSSWVENSVVRSGAKVGPFSRLRPGCDISGGAIIGNFSELKNTKVGANSGVHHLGYLGDTTLGEGVNIGAGTITCNYDGKKKHPTAIGDNAFIGSGNLLVAPVTVGDNALTGAGSVVTHDVPDGKVAFGVPARVVHDRENK